MIRPRRVLKPISAILLILIVCASTLTSTASGRLLVEPIWRLAGTFNDWSTTDDSFQLTPLPDGTFFIQFTLPAGHHEFKFVRDGAWGNEHYGAAAGATDGLAMPGQNIALDLQAEQPIAIVFDPSHKTWRRGTPEVTEPVVVARLTEPAQIGKFTIVDLSESLLPEGTSRIEFVEARPIDPRAVRVMSRNEGDDQRQDSLTILALRAGRAEVDIRIRAGEKWSQAAKLVVNVHDRVVAQLPGAVESGAIDLVPIDGAMEWAGIFESPSDRNLAAKIHDMGTNHYLAFAINPQRAGEQFALVYSRRTNTAQAIPGRFDLVANGGEQYELLDLTPMPDSGLFHDPRRPDQFTPISHGLGLFDLTVLTDPRPGEQLTALIETANVGRIPLVRINEPNNDTKAVWKARFQIDPNDLDSGKWVRYSIQRTWSGPTDQAQVIGPFEKQVTPTFETPDWAKTAVWYQIFPERFRNGNEINDPHGPGVFMLPWNAVWHVVHPGEFEAWQARVRAAGENPDQWDREKTGEPGGRFYNVVWDRRYGGDLQGIIDKLADLQQLGVNALYLNPVFEGLSMHKYDTSDFRHIDDNFGNETTQPPADWSPDPVETYDDPTTWKWTEADVTFLRLIREAHARGMKIIIDGVFNHVGRFHPAFQDVVKNGIRSPYAEWFTATFDDNGNLKSWVAWDGPNGWLPKLRQNADRSLVWPVQEHIFDITSRWMDPNNDGDPSDGIDGWRLDVPLDVGDPFWRDWCDHVRSINPEAYITSEIWTDRESVSRLKGDMFDAQMDYPFAIAVIDWLAMRPSMTSDELGEQLRDVFSNDAPQTQLVQQNLLGSHDTDRLVSDLYNSHPPRNYDAGNRPQQGEPYDESKPDDHAYALSRLALVFQATYVGAPMIYYGDEVGMYGADDPSNRKPYPWPDLDPPMVNPGARADLALQRFYQTWLRWRARNQTLQLGMVRHIQTGDPDVFAFERRLNDDVLMIVINRNDEPFDATELLGLPDLDGEREVIPPMGAIMQTVEPE